jgi:hypothetical protein
MALATSRRNGIALVLLIATYIAYSQASELYAHVFRDMPWRTSMLIVAVELFAFGAASFFAFGGGFWTRTGLTVCVPALSHVVLELVWGSDPAYPYLTLLLAIPFSALFFLGAVLVGGSYLVWRDSRRKSHLTPRSTRTRADAPPCT